MTLGDRIAVLRDGGAEQIAPPLEVYRRPANAFVAGFVGSPKMNLLDVSVVAANGGLAINGSGFRIDNLLEPLAGAIDQRVRLQVGIRARDIVIVRPGQGDAVARIDVFEPLGHETIVRAVIEAGGPEVTIVANADEIPAPGETVGLKFRRDRLHLFRMEDGSRVC